MLVICSVAIWECVRGCYRTHAEQVRLRAVQGEMKLPKKDMRKLNALLQRKLQDLTIDERQTLVSLAEAAGVDLKGVFPPDRAPEQELPTAASSSSFRATHQWQEPPTASAADEEFLRQRRRQRAALPRRPSPPRSTYEDLVEEDERQRRAIREPLVAPREPLGASSLGGTRDAAVQVELLREMPRVVFTTPSGGCVHATRDCSTLARSTKYIQKDVCAKCIPGQREQTERPK